jgi:hypothetical protein
MHVSPVLSLLGGDCGVDGLDPAEMLSSSALSRMESYAAAGRRSCHLRCDLSHGKAADAPGQALTSGGLDGSGAIALGGPGSPQRAALRERGLR